MTATAMKRIGNGEDAAQTGRPINALANLTDGDRFTQLQRVAKMMGSSALTPQHLKGKSADETTANCFRVVNQAMRWGFDPFAVGDETYVVRGKLGYQGKLVAAVINSRAGLVGRLSAAYKGSGDGRTVTITGQFESEDAPRTIDLSVGQAKTDNGMWIKDPDQKLFYSGVAKWARRHCPELILGVMTVEDLEGLRSGREEQAETMQMLDAEILKSAPVAAAEEKAANEPAKADTSTSELPDDQDAEAISTNIQDAIDAATTVAESATVGAKLKEARAQIGDARYKALLGMLQAANKVIYGMK